jgi:ribonuclease BN (tRNA processing enzyme)
MNVQFTVLGSTGSWPSAGRATSGYLVAHEGFNFWIDLGTGTLARLQAHLAHRRRRGRPDKAMEVLQGEVTAVRDGLRLTAEG